MATPNPLTCIPQNDDAPPFTFETYYSQVDGVPVVHVETPEEWDDENGAPRCRIYLNDGEIYENPIFPHRVKKEDIA